MKLVELLGVKSLYDKDTNSLINLINTDQFKMIGKGSYARVFDKNGLIYKFWLVDDAYEKFIEYVQKHQDNPHLPKLKSPIKTISTFFKVPSNFPKKIKYVKLEKLEPYNNSFYEYNINVSDDDRLSYVKFFNDLSFKERWLLDQTDPKILIKHLETKFDIKITNKSAIDLLTNLFNICLDLKKLGLDMDIHDENFMFRGDTVVITDPIYDSNQARINTMYDGIENLIN